MIGLMSDVGHWQDFGEFLDPDDIGVMPAPVITPGATPSLPAPHVALSATTLDLMGRLSQQLLSGSVTVDDALSQLAAADRGN